MPCATATGLARNGWDKRGSLRHTRGQDTQATSRRQRITFHVGSISLVSFLIPCSWRRKPPLSLLLASQSITPPDIYDPDHSKETTHIHTHTHIHKHSFLSTPRPAPSTHNMHTHTPMQACMHAAQGATPARVTVFEQYHTYNHNHNIHTRTHACMPLRKQPQLEELNLRDCALEDDGAVVIVE